MVEKENNPAPKEPDPEKRLQYASEELLNRLHETDLVSCVIMARQKDILNVAIVYRQDVPSEEALQKYDPDGDIRFISSDFQIKTMDILTSHVSSISPSEIITLSKKWEKEGVDNDTIQGVVFPSQKHNKKIKD